MTLRIAPNPTTRLDNSAFWVQFTDAEIWYARVVAECLCLGVYAQGRTDRQVAGGNPIDLDTFGLLGEMAASVIVGGAPDWEVSQPQKGGDLRLADGRTVEVKTATRKGGDFNRRQDDDQMTADLGVLVWPLSDDPKVGNPFRAFALVGWISRDDFRYWNRRRANVNGDGHHYRAVPWNLTRQMFLWPGPLQTLNFRRRSGFWSADRNLDREVAQWTKQTERHLSTLPPNMRELRNRSDVLDDIFIVRMRAMT